MGKSFLNKDKALLTAMVQANHPDKIKELIAKSLSDGAEAFGMQFERLYPPHRNKQVYRELFDSTGNKPVYVTNYRSLRNEGKSDEQLAEELLELAECGATLCDVMGDYFDPCPGEYTTDDIALGKQKDLISKLHSAGAEVVMSTHISEFTPAERVLEIALGHQSRGADISKIVTDAATMEEQIENIRIANLLKNNLKIPFLFLCGGESHILRRIGGELGCCMYLCVCEHDDCSTPEQPILKEIKAIRDNMRLTAIDS